MGKHLFGLLSKAFLFLLLTVVLYDCSSQTERPESEAGKIYINSEADSLFGTVIESIELDTSLFISLMEKTSNYIMFNINEGELFVLGDGRKALYPEGAAVANEVIFSVFTKNIGIELLEKGKGEKVLFEKRDCKIICVNGKKD